MQAIFFLIPLALLFCALMIRAFFWAVSHRQFDNLDAAAHSVLFDEDERAIVDARTNIDTEAERAREARPNDGETKS